MATVHPSRMGLIPQEMRGSLNERPRGRSPSPRRSQRSPSPRLSGSRDRDRERGRDGDYSRRDERGRDLYRPSEPRRPSPKYEDYRRPAPPPGGEPSAPWRQQENMYPPRRENHGAGSYSGGNANAGFMESRRLQREAQTVNVWPPSPKAPARELSPKGKRSSKKSKRHRSVSSDTDSSEEERRRRKKERKRARKYEKEDKKDSDKRRHRHKSRHSDDDDDSDDDHRRHKHRNSKRSRSRTRSKSKSVRPRSRTPRSRSRTPERMEEDRALKRARSVESSDPHSRQVSIGAPPSSKAPGDSGSDDEVGPQPLAQKGGKKKVDERAYGGALLRGEGSAMAAFLQEGTEARIPRRGEIGLTPDEIAKYEDVGYVMSGSRHRRMNAVRMRKENQVISAEEKRGILKLQREERERKEAILRDEFSLLVDEKLKGSGAPGL